MLGGDGIEERQSNRSHCTDAPSFGYDDAPTDMPKFGSKMLSWVSQLLYLAKIEGSRFHNRGWDQNPSL